MIIDCMAPGAQRSTSPFEPQALQALAQYPTSLLFQAQQLYYMVCNQKHQRNITRAEILEKPSYKVIQTINSIDLSDVNQLMLQRFKTE